MVGLHHSVKVGAVMDDKTFLAKLTAIDGQVLDMVERHDKLIALLLRFVKESMAADSPCDADSVTSSPDSA